MRKIARRSTQAKADDAKTVVVTGATSGIGKAIALAFRDAGARVALIGRSPGKMAAVTRQFPAAQVAGAHTADLGSVTAVRALLRKLNDTLPRLDALVLAAGHYSSTKLGVLDADELDRLFAANVRAPYLLIQGLLPMLEHARGQVILVGSSVVNSPGAGVAAFKSTQHALQGLADSLRQDLNERGIRLSVLYPGQTNTPRIKRMYAQRRRKYDPAALLQPEDLASLAVALTALPAGMEITDVRVRSVHRY